MFAKEGHIGDVMVILCPYRPETIGWVKMWRALRRVNGETLKEMANKARPIEATLKIYCGQTRWGRQAPRHLGR